MGGYVADFAARGLGNDSQQGRCGSGEKPASGPSTNDGPDHCPPSSDLASSTGVSEANYGSSHQYQHGDEQIVKWVSI
jgi:hypothetical protein